MKIKDLIATVCIAALFVIWGYWFIEFIFIDDFNFGVAAIFAIPASIISWPLLIILGVVDKRGKDGS